jgi:putative transposase
LSISRQCQILGISRSSYYCKPKDETERGEVELLGAILEILQEIPFYGYRKVTLKLQEKGHMVTRKQVRRIMHRAGLKALYAGKKTSKPNKMHPKYPYLLRNKAIWLPNQVWAADITYIRLSGGYVYLVAIVDLYSRKVLSWKISNTMDSQFCVAALEEAIAIWGFPAIFNTDQGSQFSSDAFTSILKSYGIEISMDGVKRALDNIYVERLWRSLKYEEIYLNDYASMNTLRYAVNRYFKFFNQERYHQSLEYKTPDEIYNQRFHLALEYEAVA